VWRGEWWWRHADPDADPDQHANRDADCHADQYPD
jgi:hypothetical protein